MPKLRLAPQDSMTANDNDDLFKRTAELLKQPRSKTPAVRLDPLDTTVPPYNSTRSSALSGLSESSRSFSASRIRSGRTPTALELPKQRQMQQLQKALPASPRVRRSPKEYLNRFLSSPRFCSDPPLSAQSAEFLLNLQRTFVSAVDVYLYRRFQQGSATPPVQPISLDKEAQISRSFGPTGHDVPLTTVRKVVLYASALLMAIVLGILIYLLSANVHQEQASHFLMGGSGLFVILAGGMMFAARRSLGEVLVMAVLVVLICHCVMDDFNVSLA